MTIEHFWQIIDATSAPTQEQQLELLRDELRRLAADQIIAFEGHLLERSIGAYQWDLWCVAWLFMSGMCSDDRFSDFRSWLISRGRGTYQAAIANADSLAEALRHTEVPSFELFGYVPSKIFEEKIGGELPWSGLKHPSQPSGGEWFRPTQLDYSNSKLLNRCIVFDSVNQEDLATIQNRFPEVWRVCQERGLLPTFGPATLPTPESIAGTIDPSLASTDFKAYLQALGDAAKKVYKRK